MKRITTTVDPGVYSRLEELARGDGVPAARLIREAMEQYVTDRESIAEPPSLPDWVGMVEGPGGPHAVDDEAILEAEWANAIEADRSDRAAGNERSRP